VKNNVHLAETDLWPTNRQEPGHTSHCPYS